MVLRKEGITWRPGCSPVAPVEKEANCAHFSVI